MSDKASLVRNIAFGYVAKLEVHKKAGLIKDYDIKINRENFVVDKNGELASDVYVDVFIEPKRSIQCLKDIKIEILPTSGIKNNEKKGN